MQQMYKKVEQIACAA